MIKFWRCILLRLYFSLGKISATGEDWRVEKTFSAGIVRQLTVSKIFKTKLTDAVTATPGGTYIRHSPALGAGGRSPPAVGWATGRRRPVPPASGPSRNLGHSRIQVPRQWARGRPTSSSPSSSTRSLQSWAIDRRPGLPASGRSHSHIQVRVRPGRQRVLRLFVRQSCALRGARAVRVGSRWCHRAGKRFN